VGDRIEVPLELENFDVKSTVLVEGWLQVTVSSTLPPACFHCGSVEVIGHGRHMRRIRDRSCGYPTVLIWEQRRLCCRDCGRSSRERHPALAGRKRISLRFLEHLGKAAVREPFLDVARRENVSWWRVAGAFEVGAAGLDPYQGVPPRVLSLDEAGFQRPFKFHTVLSAPEQGRVLDLVPGRSLASAQKALSSLPPGWKETVETVVVDLFWPFRRAAEETLPQARVVADKFHVLRVIDQAAQRVRKRHGRRVTVIGPQGGLERHHNPRFEPKLWELRWLFMRRHHLLTPRQQHALHRLFQANPELGVAWWLKESFAEIYRAPDRDEAERRLELWIHHLHQVQIPELVRSWKALSLWREQILNYFDDRQTNGYAEGVTNTIKVLKRRSYGHRDPHRYRAKVLLATRSQPA
jgi:transposase